MNIQTLSKWGNLTSQHPIPWYLEQCNEKGVEVRDNKGDPVYQDDFGSIPDEMAGSLADNIRTASVSLALFLVAFSEEQHENSQTAWT